jgi:hypothetical protein
MGANHSVAPQVSPTDLLADNAGRDQRRCVVSRANHWSLGTRALKDPSSLAGARIVQTHSGIFCSRGDLPWSNS